MGNNLLESFFLFSGLPANFDESTYFSLLVFGAFLLATLGAYATLSAACRIFSLDTESKKKPLRWIGAIALGSSLWSMHFLGMIADKMQMEMTYAPCLALTSLILAVGTSYFLLHIAELEKLSVRMLIGGPVLLGIGISASHFAGLEAMKIQSGMNYVPALFLFYTAFAVWTAGVTLWIVFKIGHYTGKRPILWRTIAAVAIGGIFYATHCAFMSSAISAAFADEGARFSQSVQLSAIVVITVTTLLLFVTIIASSSRVFLTVGCGALLALPLVIIVHQTITALNVEIRNIEREQYGISYHRELAQLLKQFYDVRDLTAAVRNGDAGFSAPLSAKTEELKANIAKIDVIDSSPDNSAFIHEEWQVLKSDTAALQNLQDTLPAAEVFKQYSNIATTLNSIMGEVASDTNLSADIEANNDYLIDYSVHVVPLLWMSASDLRSAAMGLLADNKSPEQWTDEDKQNLQNDLFVLTLHDEEMANMTKRAEASNNDSARLTDYHEQVVKPLQNKLSDNIKRMISAHEHVSSSADMFALVTDVRTSYDSFYTTQFDAFLLSLQQREEAREDSRTLMLYSSLAALAGFIALLIFLNRTLLKMEHAQKIALQAQEDMAQRLIEKERMEHQMQEYTDRLELSRFDIMAANTKLKEEETKIRAIMDNVMEGIITMDEGGAIQTFNKAAELVSGYTSSEAIGQNVDILVPYDQQLKPQESIQRYKETGVPDFIGTEREIIGQRKDGSHFPAVVNTSEVVLGKSKLFISLVRDITLQKEKEEDLRRTKEHAEAANRTKSEFLANMSHELRTPLNSVLGMTNLLLGTKLATEQQELARTVLSSSTNLLEIVNDILDLSKIEAGEMALERIGFDPHEVFHSVVRSLAQGAREKRVPIVRHYENETLPYLLGDPLRLGRIIMNLLSNAVKYTDEGHVDVRAYTKKLDDTHVELRCEVTDTGIGIPEEKLSSVFDKFVQADTSTTRKYGGTGLGLAITRELVALMGGKIGVDSKVGEGSTFWFTAPFEITDKLHEEKYIRQQKTLLGIVEPKNARILVAEDHPMNQLLIKQLLGKFGIGFYEIASNGVEALKSYQKGPWTAILMDCHMPEKNGYDTTIDIRDLEKTTNVHVPIVAMTANAMVGDKEKCLRSGMDEYVSKPINIEELKEVLSQWIAFDSAAAKEKSGESMTQSTPPVDLTMLRTLTGGDDEIEKELMKTFVEQSDKNLQTLLETRAAEGENKPWTEAAHMLKGGSGSIGAEILRQLCSDAQLYKGDAAGRAELFTKIDSEYTRVKDHLRKEGLLV